MTALMLGLVACTPAQPVAIPAATTPAAATTTPSTPAAIDIKTSFAAATYTNTEYGFTIKYPKTWFKNEAALVGGTFYAMSGDDVVFIAVRPATDFKAAAQQLFTDLIKPPSVDAEAEVTMADGKTKGYEILLSVSASGQTIASGSVCGVIKDGKAIMVLGAKQAKNIELYREIGKNPIRKVNLSNNLVCFIYWTTIVPFHRLMN